MANKRCHLLRVMFWEEDERVEGGTEKGEPRVYSGTAKEKTERNSANMAVSETRLKCTFTSEPYRS